MPEENMSLLDIRLSPLKSKLTTDLESEEEEHKEEVEVSCINWFYLRLFLS